MSQISPVLTKREFFNSHRRLHSKPLPNGMMSVIAIFQQLPNGLINFYCCLHHHWFFVVQRGSESPELTSQTHRNEFHSRSVSKAERDWSSFDAPPGNSFRVASCE